jgi:ABC-2 type transport system permease protein
MLLTLILPSMAVVREREIGTLEQISVTPIRPWQLILGKLPSLRLHRPRQRVPGHRRRPLRLRRPFPRLLSLLLLLTLPFLVAMLGLGLFASTLVSTQQQAMMTSIFLLMVPMIYLSGLIFPIENMPTPSRSRPTPFPLRYYNHVIRASTSRPRAWMCSGGRG